MSEEKYKVYVGNLEFSVTEEDLRKFLEEKGVQSKEVNIIKDKYTSRSKGFGFVELENEEAVKKAIEALDNQDMKGRKLRVAQARKPRERFDRGDRNSGFNA